MRKKHITILLSLLVIFAVTWAGAIFQTNHKVSANQHKKLIVGTDTNYVPFEFLDQESGEYVGFDVDLIEAIAEEVGFEYELKPMDFAGIIPALQTKNLDIAIAGISINPVREETVDFSDPYYDAGTAILVRSDEEEIQTTEDLVGKIVATKQGTSSYDYVMEIEGIKEVVPFPNIDQAYMELRKGTADAVVFDLPSLLYYIKTNGQGEVKVLDDLLEGQTFGIAFPKGSPLKNEVDLALAKLKEDGTYDELHEKWFGENSVTVTDEGDKFSLDVSYIVDALPILMQGVKFTIFISVTGILIGFLIGIVIGFGRLSKNKLIYGASSVYVQVLRGTPIMIQALYIYFAIPMMLNTEINPIVAGVTAIAINAGAYIAEIVRGAVDSIDKGQVEAGRSLGLTQFQTMRKIVWPQAFKRMIPPLGNQFIISLKDTSLLTVIGVGELTRQGTIVVATNFRAVEIYTIVAILYLVMTLSISFILRLIERKMDIS
ncbi:ABC transporter permease subunit [Pseudogracilibacillus auburnensis]|uniref:ABC transporter permease subunit n=1 Tax=Pseudogracilibacillus auburnensis TaxID=1494959 RepID=UPI001A962C3E|nr:ABC transporter permease subunit [Pseudogracilibacillus auburnensis]MBO1004187.1 ABC transporter permease subunit [Pseudogracilibacillus auburnensis]